MQGIAAHSKDQKLNSSKLIRPVWIFFGNNQKDWLKVIEQYHLPKANCFLAKNRREIIKNFNLKYNWDKELPYYFIFNDEGRCINSRAKPFTEFDVKELPKEHIRSNSLGAPPPPPPPPHG